jgi:hypothetical protein
MGWIGVLLGLIGAIISFLSSYYTVAVLCLVSSVGCFWSYGVMHNYATNMAKQRASYSGRFYDITPDETRAAPDWITRINIAFTATATIFFLLSIFGENILNYIIWSRVSAVFIFECAAALVAYFMARHLLQIRASKALAIGACLLGLIVGWNAGYRIERDVAAQSLYESVNKSYRQTRGTDMPKEEWLSVYSRHMGNNRELELYLHKRAASYSIPPFIFILFFMLRLAKRHESTDFNHYNRRPHQDKSDKDAYMERILREADARAVEEARRRPWYHIPEETRQNEEFIALLKSAVNEKMLDTIPNEEMLEICKRARSIEDASSKKLDMELSRTINTLLAEIQKRGLSYP